MQHLDEHTLAFYALGVEFSPSEKERLEAHLARCSGCRSRLEELRQINEHVATSASQEPDSGSSPEALVPIPKALSKRPDPAPVHIRERSMSRTAQVASLVRRHPYAAGSSAVAFAFLAFLSIQSLLTWSRPAGEPALVRANALGTALDVFGKDNAKLWEIPLSGSDMPTAERQRLQEYSTRFVDLDGDGRKEVVTTAPYRDGETVRLNVLRVFDGKGNLRLERPFGQPLSFNGSSYSGAFGLGGLVIITHPGTGRKELFVEVDNYRSPSFLARLDANGNTLGEYWHFGWFRYPAVVHLQGESRDLILLAGTNDVGYRTGATFPAMVILDPARIEGQSESPHSRGFGFPPSQAEVYYVKGEGIDHALVSHGKFDHPCFLGDVKLAEDSSFVVSAGFLPPDDGFQVMFTFDNTVRVRDAWMPDYSVNVVVDTYLIKKTPAGVNEFLQDLRKKIEYWNGTRWQKEPTKILPSLAAHSEPPSK